MIEHERIWLEPAGAPDRCWCQDNQWGDDGVEYVLASTLESLQRENEGLRKDKDHIAAEKAGIAKNAHNNVEYWKSQAEAAEAEVKRLRGEIAFYSCDSSTCDCISCQEDANSVTCGFRARQALASTGGEHNAE